MSAHIRNLLVIFSDNTTNPSQLIGCEVKKSKDFVDTSAKKLFLTSSNNVIFFVTYRRSKS